MISEVVEKVVLQIYKGGLVLLETIQQTNHSPVPKRPALPKELFHTNSTSFSLPSTFSKQSAKSELSPPQIVHNAFHNFHPRHPRRNPLPHHPHTRPRNQLRGQWELRAGLRIREKADELHRQHPEGSLVHQQ